MYQCIYSQDQKLEHAEKALHLTDFTLGRRAAHLQGQHGAMVLEVTDQPTHSAAGAYTRHTMCGPAFAPPYGSGCCASCG